MPDIVGNCHRRWWIVRFFNVESKTDCSSRKGGGYSMEFGVIYLVFLFYYLVNFYYRNKRLWHALMFFSMNCNMYSCFLKSTALCAHHSPCFPGNCSDTISCQCSDGFTGDTGLNRCKTCKLRFFNFALDIHVTLSEKI